MSYSSFLARTTKYVFTFSFDMEKNGDKAGENSLGFVCTVLPISAVKSTDVTLVYLAQGQVSDDDQNTQDSYCVYLFFSEHCDLLIACSISYGLFLVELTNEGLILSMKREYVK